MFNRRPLEMHTTTTRPTRTGMGGILNCPLQMWKDREQAQLSHTAVGKVKWHNTWENCLAVSLKVKRRRCHFMSKVFTQENKNLCLYKASTWIVIFLRAKNWKWPLTGERIIYNGMLLRSLKKNKLIPPTWVNLNYSGIQTQNST